MGGVNKDPGIDASVNDGRPNPVLGIHHAQITVPKDAIGAARDFYCGVLGLPETEKPKEFAGFSVLWVRVGDRNIHINTDDSRDRANSRAHIAYEVADLASWRTYLASRGLAIEDPPAFAKHTRFQFRDPFGNMVEFIQQLTG